MSHGTKIILSIIFFEVIFIVLLGLIGQITADQQGLLVIEEDFGITDTIGYLFTIARVSFTEVLPLWLTIIIFVPLNSILVYEVIARLVRGS